MSNHKLKVAASALIACAAWTTVSLAAQDGDQPGNECTPAQECWDLYICQGLHFCYGTGVFEDPELQDLCFGEFGPDPTGQGGTGYAGLYQTCMQNACEEGWGWGPNQVATAPTMEQCSDIYRITVTACKAGSSTLSPFGCTELQPDPDLVPSKHMQKACIRAAQIQLEFCKANASDSPSNTEFMNSVFPLGVAETGELDPANGVTEGAWLKVPGVDGEVPVDGARVHAMVWGDEGWEWVVLSETGPDPDGMVVPDFQLSDIDNHASLDGIELLIEWLYEGHIIRHTPVSIDFAETATGSDFDRDGSVTVADLAAYLSAYESGAPRADVNGDGAVNSQDFDQFIASFDAE